MSETAELDARTRLTEALWNDPETRGMIEDAVVKKFPHAKTSVPGRVIREEGEKTAAELRRIVAEDKKERAAEKEAAELAKARQAIRDDPELRIREDEIEPVEKLMLEETIGSHRAAARLYRAQQATATPRSEPSAMQIPGLRGAGGDEYKGLIEDPDAWGREKAHQILNDFRAGRGAQWS
jgi:hypothetical protein